MTETLNQRFANACNIVADLVENKAKLGHGDPNARCAMGEVMLYIGAAPDDSWDLFPAFGTKTCWIYDVNDALFPVKGVPGNRNQHWKSKEALREELAEKLRVAGKRALTRGRPVVDDADDD